MVIVPVLIPAAAIALNPYKQETFTPPREDRWQQINRLAAEGQRQYKTRWYGLGGEESPAPPSSRCYYLTGRPCPHDGIIKPTASLEKKLTRLTPKRCRSRLLFFRLNFACWRCSVVSHASAGRHFHKAIGWLMTRSAMSPGPKRISGRYSRRLKWATKSCSLSEN